MKMKLLQTKNSFIYEGTLTPVEWSINDEIIRYSLFLDDGEEIPLCIRNLNKVKPLQHQQVRIWGYYKDDKKYRSSFIVKRLKAIIIPTQDNLYIESPRLSI